jgi:hypothetical protein
MNRRAMARERGVTAGVTRSGESWRAEHVRFSIPRGLEVLESDLSYRSTQSSTEHGGGCWLRPRSMLRNSSSGRLCQAHCVTGGSRGCHVETCAISISVYASEMILVFSVSRFNLRPYRPLPYPADQVKKLEDIWFTYSSIPVIFCLSFVDIPLTYPYKLQ